VPDLSDCQESLAALGMVCALFEVYKLTPAGSRFNSLRFVKLSLIPFSFSILFIVAAPLAWFVATNGIF
jgi:hypothetical protein